MGAKIAAETHRAIKAVLRGVPVYKAAKRQGIEPSTIYRAMDRLGLVIPCGAKEGETK